MGALVRCFFDLTESPLLPVVGQSFSLSKEESHHLTSVLRVRRGERVVLFAGDGREWIGILDAVGTRKNDPVSLLIEKEQMAPELPFYLHLVQAMPKGKSMDQLVRRVVELGVRRITPLLSDHVEGRGGEDRWEHKLARWRAQAIEAGKQSGNSYLPIFDPVMPLADSLALVGQNSLPLFGDLSPGVPPVLTTLQDSSRLGVREVIWFIGPEGDFSDREKELMRAAGVQGVGFGPLIMRCETAALFALATTLAHFCGSAGKGGGI